MKLQSVKLMILQYSSRTALDLSKLAPNHTRLFPAISGIVLSTASHPWLSSVATRYRFFHQRAQTLQWSSIRMLQTTWLPRLLTILKPRTDRTFGFSSRQRFQAHLAETSTNCNPTSSTFSRGLCPSASRRTFQSASLNCLVLSRLRLCSKLLVS